MLFGIESIDTKYFENILTGCHIQQLLDNLDINLDYIATENGWNFSGGQRQLIAIARALLKYPKFIIFDESFNQLDMSLAKDILKFINNNFKDICIIQIAHDERLLEYSDKIIDIEKIT